jgi:hypothetical protein
MQSGRIAVARAMAEPDRLLFLTFRTTDAIAREHPARRVADGVLV